MDILDILGRKIFSGSSKLVANGYNTSDLYWDPMNMNPVPQNGTYLYRITVTDAEGRHTSGSGRLVLRKE
jgi:hypothetical protein